MGIIGTLLLIIFVIASLLIILFVLLQDDQGEGLGGIFGGGSASPLGGAGSNILIRITSFLGVAFMLCSLGVAYILRTPSDDNVIGESRRLNAQGEVEWWNEDLAPADEEAGSDLVLPEN